MHPAIASHAAPIVGRRIQTGGADPFARSSVRWLMRAPRTPQRIARSARVHVLDDRCTGGARRASLP